jgi:hypothetical protein
MSIEAERCSGVDIVYVVVDEYGVLRIEIEALEQNPEYRRRRLNHAFFARNDDPVEPIQKIEACACIGKRFGRPVRQAIQRRNASDRARLRRLPRWVHPTSPATGANTLRSTRVAAAHVR